MTRRENDASLHSQPRSLSPTWRDSNVHIHALLNGNGPSSASPSSGFVAVNANRPGEPAAEENPLPSQSMFPQSNTDNITIINGTSIKGASPTTRAELMKKFFTTADRQARGLEEPTQGPPSSRPKPRVSDPSEYSLYAGPPAPATVAIPNTPTSLLPPPRTNQQEKDDSGPYKMLMVARMEELERGQRVIPPCDRCRRLHMDCLKNLTACMGCTKKHAKCSWKDVKEEELRELETHRAQERSEDHQPRDQPAPVAPLSAPLPAPAPPVQEPERLYPEYHAERRPEPEPRPNWDHDVRRESAPVTSHSALVRDEASPPGRRAMSEIQGSAASNHDRRVSLNRYAEAADDDDPGANQRLMQAILDTVDHHSRAAAKEGSEVGDQEDRKMVRA